MMTVLPWKEGDFAAFDGRRYVVGAIGQNQTGQVLLQLLHPDSGGWAGPALAEDCTPVPEIVHGSPPLGSPCFDPA